jgi:DNA-directed RNA polymerase subunit RPC12/RpoP/predicted RNA-binding Zn-ribbon protein involved in translation (DUF1610 family)
MSSLRDKATFTYIKNVKRWMFCPACGDKMRINRKTNIWNCQNCNYKLSDKEFRSGYIFWFCDSCDSFLNNQAGFDINTGTWVCTECGFENTLTSENIADICKDCGAKISTGTTPCLCDNCREIRRKKMVKRIQTGAKIAAGAAVVVKAAHTAIKMVASDTSSSKDLSDYDSPRLEDDYPTCKSCGSKMTDFDGWAWYTCPECGNSVRIIDGTTTWHDEIFGRGTRSTGRSCSNCGESLSGGDYTAPWENGSNPDGYIKCPHCGYVNFQWEDDD